MDPLASPIELLRPDERALVEAARRFGREQVAPMLPNGSARQVPRDAIRAAARLGLTAIEVPQAQGGQGAGSSPRR